VGDDDDSFSEKRTKNWQEGKDAYQGDRLDGEEAGKRKKAKRIARSKWERHWA